MVLLGLPRTTKTNNMLRFLLLCCLSLPSLSAIAQITTRTVKDGLFIPWEIVYGPDDHIWFTQKNGFICRVNPVSGAMDTLYRETANVVRGEGGMTGMVLHPSFSTQPYVYVAHNYLQGNNYQVRIMRYTYNGTDALGSPQLILGGISGSNNHNGTRLLIDGDKLFVTTGDAETPSISQDISSINGKVLRLNLDGTIPGDNPIPGNAIWSWGHRNAQGLVMANGLLYSSEHGASSDDEINIIKKGRNYGWPVVQGFCNTPAEISFCNDSNVATPVIAWTPTIAVCGIDYYDHPMFPQWRGSLLMATLKDQRLYSLQLNAARDSVVSTNAISQVSAGRLRDICISPAGKVYVSTSNSNASGSGAHTDRIIELYDPGFTSVTEVKGSGLSVYPNPAGNTITVSLNKPVTGQYILRDMQGRTVLQGAVSGQQLVLDISGYAPGLYHISCKGQDGNPAGKTFLKK